jgi:SET domain
MTPPDPDAGFAVPAGAPVPPQGLYVADTGTAKGRGVFAARAFEDGELVEAAPVIVCEGRVQTLPSAIRELLFDWRTLGGADRIGGAHGLVLGYGSLYNHDNPANLRYEADPREPVLRFVATRRIAPGEELTINYHEAGGTDASAQNPWFARRGYAPLVSGDFSGEFPGEFPGDVSDD